VSESSSEGADEIGLLKSGALQGGGDPIRHARGARRGAPESGLLARGRAWTTPGIELLGF